MDEKPHRYFLFRNIMKLIFGMPVEMVARKIRSDGYERGKLVYGYKLRHAVLFQPIWPSVESSRFKLSQRRMTQFILKA
jgi:hypothetical protein